MNVSAFLVGTQEPDEELSGVPLPLLVSVSAFLLGTQEPVEPLGVGVGRGTVLKLVFVIVSELWEVFVIVSDLVSVPARALPIVPDDWLLGNVLED